ncbi:hypothetical protein JBE27_19790 [Streptomyces albiflaviniger]|nr:hypothetical protein [Streptomyces albiflaviniger]
MAAGSRGLLGVIFLMSVAGKVAGRSAWGAFVTSVRDMRVVPSALVRPTALAVVGAEGLVCVLLAVPTAGAALIGFVIAAVLLAVFTTGVILALHQGVRTPCRCFGRSTTPLGIPHIARNVVLGIIACAGGLATSVPGNPQPGGAVVAVFTGLLVGVLVASLDDILSLLRPLKHPAAGTVRGPR